MEARNAAKPNKKSKTSFFSPPASSGDSHPGGPLRTDKDSKDKNQTKAKFLDDFSYVEAAACIQTYFNDYTLIGTLPQKPVTGPWEVFTAFHFLFLKNNCYYTCSSNSLLKLNKREAPVMEQAEGGYLFVKLQKPDSDQYILRLRKGSDITGHERLGVGFKDLKGAAAGEIYFTQGKLSLYNHKSSYFSFPKDKVVAEINTVFMTDTASSFYEEFDPVKILEEYAARKSGFARPVNDLISPPKGTSPLAEKPSLNEARCSSSQKTLSTCHSAIFYQPEENKKSTAVFYTPPSLGRQLAPSLAMSPTLHLLKQEEFNLPLTSLLLGKAQEKLESFSFTQDKLENLQASSPRVKSPTEKSPSNQNNSSFALSQFDPPPTTGSGSENTKITPGPFRI